MDQNLILSDCIFDVIVCENMLCLVRCFVSHIQHIPWTPLQVTIPPLVGALRVL